MIKELPIFQTVFRLEEVRWKPQNEWVGYTKYESKIEDLSILGDLLTLLNRDSETIVEVLKRVEECISKNKLIEVDSIDWIIESTNDNSNVISKVDITGMGVVYNYEHAPQILINWDPKYFYIYNEHKKMDPLKIEPKLFLELLNWSIEYTLVVNVIDC